MARPARPMPEETRRGLLDEAARALLERGYERTSLNAVLDAAGVAKSSFYHRFADKQALVAALLEDRVAALAAHVPLPDPAALDADGFWPAVDALLGSLDAAARADPRTLEAGRLLHLADLPAVPARDRLRTELGAWGAGMLARGREIGRVETDTPPDLQRALAVALATELDRWSLQADAPEEQLGHQAAGRLLRRLLAP